MRKFIDFRPARFCRGTRSLLSYNTSVLTLREKMPFSVPFQLCTKKFKTGVSLKKHFGLKHQERNPGIVQFLDESNSPCEQPKAAALTDEEMEDYLKWLGVLVERINGSLVPDHPR